VTVVITDVLRALGAVEEGALTHSTAVKALELDRVAFQVVQRPWSLSPP